jgi:hypothetical protein
LGLLGAVGCLDQDQQQIEPHPNGAIAHRESETTWELFHFGQQPQQKISERYAKRILRGRGWV